MAWYGIVEPRHLTGFIENEQTIRELKKTLNEIHDYFEPQIFEDAEMLYVFGLAADMFWYMFENAETWEKRAGDYQRRYRKLEPNGINPIIFENRGAYGEYYKGQAEIDNGY